MQSLTVEAGTESASVKAPMPPRELFSSTRVGKRTVVQVGSVKIGAGQPVMMAGPMLRGVLRAATGNRRSSKTCRRRDFAWRCLQAADLAL